MTLRKTPMFFRQWKERNGVLIYPFGVLEYLPKTDKKRTELAHNRNKENLKIQVQRKGSDMHVDFKF